MTTPTGQIGFYDINVELGRRGDASLNLNDSQVRKLANKPNGTISLSDLRGKRATFSKIRFRTNAWAVKDNYGTNRIVLYNTSGGAVWDKSANPVVATSTGGNWTYYDLPEGIYNIGSIYFHRFIDTSSDGGAEIWVEVYTSYNDTWRQIHYDRNYRTGRQWEAKTVDIADVYSI